MLARPVLTANPSPFTEANLDGATLTMTLPSGAAFVGGVSASSLAPVATPALAGLSIRNVTGGESGSPSAAPTRAAGPVAVSGATRP